jgi:hypothetical protein
LGRVMNQILKKKKKRGWTELLSLETVTRDEDCLFLSLHSIVAFQIINNDDQLRIVVTLWRQRRNKA